MDYVTGTAKPKTVVVQGFVIPILTGLYCFQRKPCIRIEDSFFQTIKSPSLNTLITAFMFSTTKPITNWLSLHLS